MRSHTQNSPFQKFIAVGNQLLEPAHTVHDPELRRQARLLSSILLFLLLITCGLFVMRLPVLGFQLNAENAARVIIVLTIGLLFLLSRRGQVRLASLIATIVGSLVLFALAATGDVARSVDVLDYLVVVLLFGSLFLAARLNIAIFIAQLAGILMLGRMSPNESFREVIAGPFSLYLTIGTIVILVAWHRNLLEQSHLARLASSEQRLQDVVANNTDGMVVIDDAGIIRFLNPAAIDLFDEPVADLLGQPFSLPRIENQSTEITLAHARGVRTIEMRIVPIRWNNAPAGLASLRDITARKRAEEALRASEEKFSKTFHRAPMLITLSKLEDGTYLDVNEKFEQVSGFTSEEALGKTSLELGWISAPDRARLAQILREQGRVAGLELALHTKDRQEITCLIQGEPITIDGQPCLLTIAQDITARKRAESQREAALDALRQSETLYHTLVATLPMNVFCKNAAGQFTLGNTLFCQTTGKPWVEIAGRTDFDIHPPELAHKYRADDEQVMASKRIFETIEEYQTLGGTKGYVQTFKTALREADGRASGILGIFWDVTAHKQMEDALRALTVTLEQRVHERTLELQAANVRLTELDRLKDEFISRVGHELRTPLVNIKIYLELLEAGKPEKHDTYMITLKRETNRLQALIEDLLKIIEINQATLNRQLEAVDLNQVIAVRLAAWADLAARKRLDLRSHLAADLPPVRAEQELLLQAVEPIVNNAINYTASGAITLSTAARSDEASRWVTLSVADSGPGITPADLPHIFERFYRGHAAADYKTPGTGVGLSISQEIAAQLHGRLTVETEVGTGSTFTIWLPLA